MRVLDGGKRNRGFASRAHVVVSIGGGVPDRFPRTTFNTLSMSHRFQKKQ